MERLNFIRFMARVTMIFGIFEVLVAVSSVVLISKDVIPIEQREKIYWADLFLLLGLVYSVLDLRTESVNKLMRKMCLINGRLGGLFLSYYGQ